MHRKPWLGKRFALVAAVIFLASAVLCVIYFRYTIPFQTAVTKTSASPPHSIVIFNFGCKGDSNTWLLATGFARALADRLLCAPDSLTLQPLDIDIWDELRARGIDPRTQLSDSQASEIASRLGCYWAVTGDFREVDRRLTITVRVCRTGRSTLLKVAGNTSDLPSMQVSLAEQIADVIGLKLDRDGYRDLRTPNFSKPETLVYYGKSFEAGESDKAWFYRWKAWEADPNALFALLRVLEMYAYRPVEYRKITSEPRLARLLKAIGSRYGSNSHVQTLNGLLMLRQYKYRKAAEVLKSVVQRDIDMYLAHDALSTVAYYRRDADTAVHEAAKMVHLWSSNPRSHAMLGLAHHLAARNIQQSRRWKDLWLSARARWRDESETAIQEAQTAVALNPNCALGWRVLLYAANDSGKRSMARRAFRQLIRLSSKDWDAYLKYALSFNDIPGNKPKGQSAVIAMVDRQFGVTSAEAYLIRAYVTYYSCNPARHADKLLGYINEAIRRTRSPTSEMFGLKFSILMGMKKTDEMLDTALHGFLTWHSPEWWLFLAKAYQFEWYRSRDDMMLRKAIGLLTRYVDEIPFDVRGRNELAWCLMRLGRFEEARDELLEVLRLDPGNEFAVRQLKSLTPKSPPGFPF